MVLRPWDHLCFTTFSILLQFYKFRSDRPISAMNRDESTRKRLRNEETSMGNHVGTIRNEFVVLKRTNQQIKQMAAISYRLISLQPFKH